MTTAVQTLNKKIQALFKEMDNKRFVIPAYQRPYRWEREQCETLWEDIVDFYDENKNEDPNKTYFLGCVVSFKQNDTEKGKGDVEIIDGQQRITSFLLLLRAFYTYLEQHAKPQDLKAIGMKNQIAPCVWIDTDKFSFEVNNTKSFRLLSDIVANEKARASLYHILETGEALPEAADNYSENYRFFLSQCQECSVEFLLGICLTLLNHCTVLQFECSDMDSAFRIFSTLNNRGMPLEDADIFKAELYKHYQEENQEKAFTEQWENLVDICENAKLTINDIFRYYTHILRAREGNTGKEIGLRAFYQGKDGFKKLKAKNLLPELTALAEFWQSVNQEKAKNKEEDDIEADKLSFEARKYLHVMKHYPNDLWKFVVSVFFIKHQALYTQQADDFNALFANFMEKLTAYYYGKFIEQPSVNGIKTPTFTLCKNIEKNEPLEFSKVNKDEEQFKQNLKANTKKLTSGLLLLKAYLNKAQQEEIIGELNVEHILPRKWQNTNYQNWTKEIAENYLNCFGNLVIFDKRLNIQAGNGYFGKKKEQYKLSVIQEVKDLLNFKENDWTVESVKKRQSEFEEKILEFFTENLN